ncbi:MAG: TonB-dependent receptor [Rubrivivax sp.]|nr:MAG: TonB-dependent receptor [Rubrivivax sp.]
MATLAALMGADFATSPAWAQNANSDTTAESSLPNVTVQGARARSGSLRSQTQTGSKTDTPLRDLPASVVVVPKEVLHDQGTLTMNQAVENVSGVQPVMGGGYGFANNYVIRGQAMRFLRDGYFDGTTQNGYWRTFADVERVEVLKGPGSALYGAGQPGGSLNVVTKQPQRRFGAELSTTMGSFGTVQGTADITGPLSSNVAARLIVNTEKTDGWRDLSREINEVLPSLTWWVNDSSTVTIDYDHRELKVKPDNYGLPFNINRQIVPVPLESKYYSPFNYSDQTIDRLTLGHEWQFSSDLLLRTALVQDWRSLDMLRNAGGAAGDVNNAMTGRNVRTQNDDARYLSLQNEIVWKFGEPTARHTVLAGVEFNRTRADTVRIGYDLNLNPIANINQPVVQETSLAGLPVLPAQGFNRHISSQAWGLYAQDQIAFGEQFKLRAGLRTESAKVTDQGLQGTSVVPRTVKDTVTWTTGSLGGVWQPSGQTSFYAGWSNGKFVNLATEAGKVNVSADGTVIPESSSQLEVGAKLSLLDNKLDLTTALFETRRQDYYITLPGNQDPTPDGKDRTRGFELDLSGSPVTGLTTTANLVWQDAKTTANANASITGKRPAGVAKTGARLWAAYRLQAESLRGWGVGGGVTYRGDTYADSQNLYRVPSYTVLDASVFYETKSWDIGLNLRNLTDRRYFTNATFSGALPGEERSAFLTARLRFN